MQDNSGHTTQISGSVAPRPYHRRIGGSGATLLATQIAAGKPGTTRSAVVTKVLRYLMSSMVDGSHKAICGKATTSPTATHMSKNSGIV